MPEYTVIYRNIETRAALVTADSASEAWEKVEDKPSHYESWDLDKGVDVDSVLVDYSLREDEDPAPHVPIITAKAFLDPFTRAASWVAGWTRQNPPAQEWRGKQYATREEAITVVEDEIRANTPGVPVPPQRG